MKTSNGPKVTDMKRLFLNMKRGERRKSRRTVGSTIINAAAFQDHLVRNLNLSLSNPRVRSRKPTSPAVAISHEDYRRVWVCETCTFENEQGNKRCNACHCLRQTATTGRLTLAQTRGLVAKPPPKLTTEQWTNCEEQADHRGDTENPCAICREPFRMEQQVILSCSHMFHKECLASFERFLRTSQRTCPLCRKSHYQKKLTTKGAQSHRKRCIIVLQSLIRGFLARRLYRQALLDFYKSGRGDTDRRHLYFADRISTVSDRLLCAVAAKNDSIDSLLAEFDRTMDHSRQVFSGTYDEEKISPWRTIYRKAMARDESECPICINPIGEKEQALLSCSHLFHIDCLHAFEEFNIYEIHLCPVCRSKYEAKALNPQLRNEWAI